MAYQKIDGINDKKTERGDCSERWELIRAELPQEGVVLDIGCAEGYFLKQIAEETNLLVVGIEKNYKRVEYQKKWLNDYYEGKVISCHYDFNADIGYKLANSCEWIDTIFCLSVLHWMNNDFILRDLASIAGKMIIEIPPINDYNATGQKFLRRMRSFGDERTYLEIITQRKVRLLGWVKAHTSTYRSIWVIEGDIYKRPLKPHIDYKGNNRSFQISYINNRFRFIKKGILQTWTPGINMATVRELNPVFPCGEWWDKKIRQSIDDLDKSKIKGDLRIHNLIVSREKFTWIDLNHHGHKATIYEDLECLCATGN